MKKVVLTKVDGVTLFAKKGLVEHELTMESEGSQVKLTVYSGAYENGLGEFMVNDMLSEDLKAKADTVLSVVTDKVEQVDEFNMYTLKDEYKDLLRTL